jgi:hypothetical protein
MSVTSKSESFARRRKTVKVRALYYPWRIVIILRRAKLFELEAFLEAEQLSALNGGR